MRALRKFLRWQFAVMAYLCVQGTLLARVPLFAYVPGGRSLPIGYIAGGVIFALAWWTTRKPDAAPYRWAVAASVLQALFGLALLAIFLHYPVHGDPYLLAGLTGFNLAFFLAGLAGTVVFFRKLPAHDRADAKPPRPASLPGDRTNRRVTNIAVYVAAAALMEAIWLVICWADRQRLPFPSGIVCLALFFASALLTTFIHECGHAVVAISLGMKLHSFQVGPFCWRKRSGRWSFAVQAKTLFSLDGSVGAVPTRKDPSDRRYICMVAGGPFANVVFCLVFAWAVIHIQGTAYEPAWMLLGYTAAQCLVAAIYNLFPGRTLSGHYTDGAHILQMLTGSPLAVYDRVARDVSRTLVTPLRLCDMDIAAIRHAAGLFPNTYKSLYMHLLAAEYFEDLGQLEGAGEARAAARKIYTEHSIDLPPGQHVSFICHAALIERDPAEARTWWDRMVTAQALKPETKGSEAGYWMASAALLWSEGSFHASDEALRNVEALHLKLPQAGSYQYDRDRAAWLRTELDRALSPAPAPQVTITAPLRAASEPAREPQLASA